MPDLQRILQQQQLSLHLHRNQQSSVQYPVHGIPFQEHYWQECLQCMINKKKKLSEMQRQQHIKLLSEMQKQQIYRYRNKKETTRDVLFLFCVRQYG